MFVVGATVPAAAADPEAPPLFVYDVTAGPRAEELAVEAHFPRFANGALTIDDEVSKFVRDVKSKRGEKWESVVRAGDQWTAPGCAEAGCEVRYRFLLGRAARDLQNRRDALAHHGAFASPPSSWLLRPDPLPPSARMRLHVGTPPGTSFVTGIYPSSDGAPDTYEAPAAALDDAPYSAFGSFEMASLKVPGGSLVVAISQGKLSIDRKSLLAWIDSCASAVAGYFVRFPVPRVAIIVLAGDSGGVGFGTAMGNGGASILLWLGRDTAQADLTKDWVLTHEMVHLGFPALSWKHKWLEEGIATYVEPIARARLGTLPSDDVWHWLLIGLPKGLPEDGDEGLDNTHTWGRTYWGGALFCFLADLEIRKRTNNAHSLDDALRGIVAAGGNQAENWSIAQALEAGDRATGVPVLEELYASMANAPHPVDMQPLWKQLGVALRGEQVVYDDSAPLAPIRKSITNPQSTPAPASVPTR
jgi:predicted metalloprotease with PDZ domain